MERRNGTLKKNTGPGTLNQANPGVQRSGLYQDIFVPSVYEPFLFHTALSIFGIKMLLTEIPQYLKEI